MTFQRHNSRAAKLTGVHVATMRQEYEDGATQGELARKYRISVVQVGRIVRGEAWAAVPAAPVRELSEDELQAQAARIFAGLGGKPPVKPGE